MKKLVLLCSLVAVLCMINPAAEARTEFKPGSTILLDEQPIDTAVSSDGKTLYILTRRHILAYSLQGERVTNMFQVGRKYNGITVTPDESMLLLTSTSGRSIDTIMLAQVIDMPVGTSPVIGPKDAPVTLTAFFDFQCPHCNRVFPAMEQLLKAYPDTLNVVIKHFPLRSHTFAATASIAALAADRQGKYLEFTRKMLENFRALNEENINKFAAELGLDLDRFQKDREDQAFQRQIQQDRALAREVGVRGVPSLYINGDPVQNRSVAGMSAMIDAALKNR